jgi:predicted dehydrogenase
LILDMFAHWRYIFDRLLGEITAVSCRATTALPERRDEAGNPYPVDVEDTAFAIFEVAGGVLAQVGSSWASRVKRDDLLQIQVDGTRGSAVCGLHRCFVQPLVATPKPFFDPERPQPMVFDQQRRAQHLQPSTPSRLALDAPDLPSRGGEPMAECGRGCVIARPAPG